MSNNNNNNNNNNGCLMKFRKTAKTGKKQCCVSLSLVLLVVVLEVLWAPSVQSNHSEASPSHESERVEQIIWPNDMLNLDKLEGGAGRHLQSAAGVGVDGNGLIDLRRISYVIDNKRFVESVKSRCLSSTILVNPDSVEPSFVFIKQEGEVRLNATTTASKDDLLRLAGFEPHKATIVIVHGFMDSYPRTRWLRNVRDLFQINKSLANFNLIFMDWGNVSRGSYAQVAAITSGMGSFLANLLMKLIELGADRRSMHIIGHSLGGQLAGFAGKRIRPRIGRITALDPAGPCFGKLFSNSPEDRLTPDDAMEVVVYHYNDAFLGFSGRHGHFDVLVNGGSSQPGAKSNLKSIVSAILNMASKRHRDLSESHSRPTRLVTAQLAQTNCQQVAYQCRSWRSFLSGECGKCDHQNNQCFFMGFPFQYQPFDQQTTNKDDKGHLLPPLPRQVSMSGFQPFTAPHLGQRLYVATSSNDTFCLHHHQILVNLEPHEKIIRRARRNGWRFHLELTNERQEKVDIKLKNQMAPGVFSYLLLSDATPARFTSARLKVRQSRDNCMRVVALKDQQLSPINNVEINFMSHENPDVRRSLSSRLCPSPPPVASSNSNLSPADDHDYETDWLTLEKCDPIK